MNKLLFMFNLTPFVSKLKNRDEQKWTKKILNTEITTLSFWTRWRRWRKFRVCYFYCREGDIKESERVRATFA